MAEQTVIDFHSPPKKKKVPSTSTQAPLPASCQPLASTEFLDPKFASEVSFLLATVVAGAAVVRAMTEYTEHHGSSMFIDIALFAKAMAVVLTTLRFFHGNVMWQYLNYVKRKRARRLARRQRAFQRFSSYYIHIMQYVLFFLAASSIGRTEDLLGWMIVISALDVAWTFSGYMNTEAEILRRALGSWCLLNVATGLLCGLTLWHIDSFESSSPMCSMVIFSIFLITGILDYLVNIELYFGNQEEEIGSYNEQRKAA